VESRFYSRFSKLFRIFRWPPQKIVDFITYVSWRVPKASSQCEFPEQVFKAKLLKSCLTLDSFFEVAKNPDGCARDDNKLPHFLCFVHFYQIQLDFVLQRIQFIWKRNPAAAAIEKMSMYCIPTPPLHHDQQCRCQQLSILGSRTYWRRLIQMSSGDKFNYCSFSARSCSTATKIVAVKHVCTRFTKYA
jgi:hypothetical protein